MSWSRWRWSRAAGVVVLAARVLMGRPEDVANWLNVALYAGLAVYLVRRRRALRRSLALNSDPSAGE